MATETIANEPPDARVDDGQPGVLRVIVALLLCGYYVAVAEVYWGHRYGNDYWNALAAALITSGATLAGASLLDFLLKSTLSGAIHRMAWFALALVLLADPIIFATDGLLTQGIGWRILLTIVLAFTFFAVPFWFCVWQARSVARQVRRRTEAPQISRLRLLGFSAVTVTAVSLVTGLAMASRYTRALQSYEGFWMPPIFSAEFTISSHYTAQLTRHYETAGATDYLRLIEAVKASPPSPTEDLDNFSRPKYISPTLRYLNPLYTVVGTNSATIELYRDALANTDVKLTVMRDTNNGWTVDGHFGHYSEPTRRLWPKPSLK